jgi:CDP-diacylglycerol--serine O-phosphatidyltransferase
MDSLFTALYLQIPVVIGGVLHMLAVTRNWLPGLRRPVNTRLFGANKTWRGIVLVPLMTTFGALCLWPTEWLLGDESIYGNHLLLAGWMAGWGYVLAELPNSFLKRRLGIAPGATPDRHRRLFIFLDQLDSGVGVAIAYALYPGFDWVVCLLYALTFPLTALLVKRWLFYMKLKKVAV